MSDDELVLGIDLGTTNSVVSIFQKNNPRVFQDEFGNKLIPSFIAFEREDKMLIGDIAKEKLGEKYIPVIYDAKRLIGRTCDDPNVKKDKQNWPFYIKAGGYKKNKPIIIINPKKDLKYVDIKNGDREVKFTELDYSMGFTGNVEVSKRPYSADNEIQTIEKELTPEEVSSFILKKLKEMAEAELNKEVKKAVITVPAYFNNSQRESIKIAGELAGLKVLRIINEPIAAALAYGLNETNDNLGKKILVFDLGGGTFDVTILSIDEERIFEILSTDGDLHLGGRDFDQELFKLAYEKFAMENNEADLDENVRAKIRLKKACENAKIILSEKNQTIIKLEKIKLGLDFEITFTRKQFEELCKPYFDKCLVTVDNALKLAEVKENDIKFIVLIGGSTRIPYIRNMLKNKFKNSKLCFNINPDETVSIGAAIQGAILTQKIKTKIRDVNPFDVTPLSLGIGCNSKIDFIIKKNTPTPITKKKIFYTEKDNQASFILNILF